MGPYIKVEYDLGYQGGEYDGTGEILRIPVEMLKDTEGYEDFKSQVERVFTALTDHPPIHIIHYSNEVFEDDEPRPSLIGYQIVHSETDNPPAGMTTYQVFRPDFVIDWFGKLSDDQKPYWRILPIFEGDVDEPRMMPDRPSDAGRYWLGE